MSRRSRVEGHNWKVKVHPGRLPFTVNASRCAAKLSSLQAQTPDLLVPKGEFIF